MALTKEQLNKYGLTSVDSGSIDDGVIKSGSNYYKLNNFERQQNEKLDTDQGDVFSSSLEADSGADFTNFNTINDVQGAVQKMEGNAPAKKKEIKYSPELQAAHDRVNQYDQNNWDGTYSENIFGASKENGSTVATGGVDDANAQQQKAAQLFADGYKDQVKRDIKSQLDKGIEI